MIGRQSSRSPPDCAGKGKTWIAIGCFASAVLAAPASAQRFGAESFILGNGMQVVVVPNHRVPAVVQMVWYKLGAADDPLGKSGIAHFLEHLMFKGTAANPPGALTALIARNGGRDNAFTTHDYTVYHETIARDRLDLVMRLEADRMTGLVLDDKVVLPSQAEAMVAVLDRKGIPHAYIAFEGEGHGFRRQENVRRSLEATLSFIGQIFGFAAADELEPLELTSAR